MLTKLIICKTLKGKREDFSQAQEQWANLCGVSGFCGQIGGWDLKDSRLAVILGLWQNHNAYQEFMDHTHDIIFKNNKQRETYGSSTVSLWKKMMTIPGAEQDILSALATGAILRLADCTVKKQSCALFLENQKKIWNPAMAKIGISIPDCCEAAEKGTGALLAGAFHQSLKQENRFLVATIWKDEESYKVYTEKHLPDLQKKAQVNKDLEHILGYSVHLKKNWYIAKTI